MIVLRDGCDLLLLGELQISGVKELMVVHGVQDIQLLHIVFLRLFSSDHEFRFDSLGHPLQA